MSETQSGTENDSDQYSSGRVSRRTVLSSLGAASAGAIGVQFSPMVAGRSTGDAVVIPTVKHQGEVIEEKIVPKKWWAHEQRADEVANRLRSRYRDVLGIDGVGLGRSSDSIAGRYGTQVIVYTDPNSDHTMEIPDQLAGIPVSSKETYNPRPDCYNGDYDYVPGGAQVECDIRGSATCPVSTSGGGNRLMTAAHLYNRCSSNPVGKRLDQSGQFVGLISDGSIRQDWVIAPLDKNAQVDGFDNTIAGTYRQVTGYVTRSGLKDLKSTGETVYKNGIASCETTGQVLEIEVTNRVCEGTSSESVSYKYAKTSTRTESGDSGSPHYKEFYFNQDSKAAIIMPHFGGDSIGCAAYRIHNVHGIDFGI